MIRRTEQDLLHPERVLMRLLQDYSTGALQNRPNSAYFRARVEAVDPTGGQLESVPPNPPNSVRARIYTSGMDFNLPSSALNVYYPLGDQSPVGPGEHVLVTFEDQNQSSGYWVSKLPRGYNQNYTNPDDMESSGSDTSVAFGDSSPTRYEPNPTFQYGGVTSGPTREQSDVVDQFERASDSWGGKRVLAIGDSQCEGSPGRLLGTTLREHNIQGFTRAGRTSWGVQAWLQGRLPGPTHASEPLLPRLEELMTQFTPNVVVIFLGGNDGGDVARSSTYEAKVRQLWTIATNGTDFALWSGPPTATGRNADLQPGRDVANDKIRNVVGSDHFIDCRTVTNTEDGRRDDGVHFTRTSSALEPWISLIIEKGAT